MLYRIDADSQETLTEIMKKLNTTKAGFQIYWYGFDYYERNNRNKVLQSEGWFVDLDETYHDLAKMADTLKDYVIVVKDGWTKNHKGFSSASTEDDGYFDAIPLYIVERKVSES